MKYLLAALLFFLPLGAMAQPVMPQAPAAVSKRIYAAPSAANIDKAMLRVGALDITRPEVLQDYLLLNECKLFIKNMGDDFQLQKLRQAVGQVVVQQRAGWPDAFYFVSPLQLDKYDFTQQSFMLKDKSQIRNVNSFVLLELRQEICQQGQALQHFPATASVRVDQPVTVMGLPLDEATGKQLLKSLTQAGNTAREVYARFNITVNYMPPFIKGENHSLQKYIFDGTLTSIEFFEDEKLTKPIWVFTRG